MKVPIDNISLVFKKRKSEKEKALTVEQDLANLKSELGEIKSLLKELVNGN